MSLISLIESCSRTVAVADTLCERGVHGLGHLERDRELRRRRRACRRPPAHRRPRAREDAPRRRSIRRSAWLTGVSASVTVAVATTSSPTSAKLDGAFGRVLWTTSEVMTGGGFGPDTT